MSRITFNENDTYFIDVTNCDLSIIDKLGELEDILDKYNINDLSELEMALDYYEHRFDDVQTRRKKE